MSQKVQKLQKAFSFDSPTNMITESETHYSFTYKAYVFLWMFYIYIDTHKLNWSRYRTSVAQRVSRVIALLFHDRGTRRGWVVSSTPRPHFTPGKDPVPVLQEAGWAPGPVWTGGKSRPHRDSIPDHSDRSQSLYRLSYHIYINTYIYIHILYIHIYKYIYTYIVYI